MGCLCCGDESVVGALCRACAQAVTPCDGLIADHLRSTVDPDEAVAWVVDGFGTAHALGARSTLGRSQDGQLVILAGSVSREHARIEQSDGAWSIRDVGSHNGSFLDNQRLQSRVALPRRARIRIGDVALWFLAEVAYEPHESGSFATASVGGGGMVRFLLAPATGELALFGGADANSAGALLARTSATAEWREHQLSPLEFQLLRALATRAIAEASLPSAVRGCVATLQLARDLPFKTRFANEENVRQVVRRLRKQFEEAGFDAKLLGSSAGRGYYLACTVTISG